jgi:PPOX class probable F420-dependent enzyme
VTVEALVAVPDSHRDLLAAPGVAVLSTVGPDGVPQSTAVWYYLDGDTVRMSLHRARQKYQNLLTRPIATLFLLDPTNPYRTLEIRADVTVADDPDSSFFERVVRHYGQDPAEFPAPKDNRAIVTFTPRKVNVSG